MKRGRTEMRRAATKMMRCLMPGHHCCPPRRHAATNVNVPFEARASVSLRPATIDTVPFGATPALLRRPATNMGVSFGANNAVSPAPPSHAATRVGLPFGADAVVSLRARPIPVCHLVAQQRVPRPLSSAAIDKARDSASCGLLPGGRPWFGCRIAARSAVPPATPSATMAIVPHRGHGPPVAGAPPELFCCIAAKGVVWRPPFPATMNIVPFGATAFLLPARAAMIPVPVWAISVLPPALILATKALMRAPRPAGLVARGAALTHVPPCGRLGHAAPTLSGSQHKAARIRHDSGAAGPATIITLPSGAEIVVSPAPLAAARSAVPFGARAVLRQPRATSTCVPFGAMARVSPAPFNHRRQG